MGSVQYMPSMNPKRFFSILGTTKTGASANCLRALCFHIVTDCFENWLTRVRFLQQLAFSFKSDCFIRNIRYHSYFMAYTSAYTSGGLLFTLECECQTNDADHWKSGESRQTMHWNHPLNVVPVLELEVI